jgi:hypothetical protein
MPERIGGRAESSPKKTQSELRLRFIIGSLILTHALINNSEEVIQGFRLLNIFSVDGHIILCFCLQILDTGWFFLNLKKLPNEGKEKINPD